MGVDRLASMIINDQLNDLVAKYADYDDDESGNAWGKRVPYVGWFWRYVNFVDADFVIGDCVDFVGFMENNKWGYRQRRLTPEEASLVVGIVCEAYRLNHQGGNMAEIIGATKAKLEELWPLLQSFTFEEPPGFTVVGPQGVVGRAPTRPEAEGLLGSLVSAAPGWPYRIEREGGEDER